MNLRIFEFDYFRKRKWRILTKIEHRSTMKIHEEYRMKTKKLKMCFWRAFKNMISQISAKAWLTTIIKWFAFEREEIEWTRRKIEYPKITAINEMNCRPPNDDNLRSKVVRCVLQSQQNQFPSIIKEFNSHRFAKSSKNHRKKRKWFR